jgi:hypothetical protein
MADVADIAGENDEYNLIEARVTSRKPTGPAPTGRCHYCDEIVADDHPFCDPECRDEFDREQRLRARS